MKEKKKYGCRQHQNVPCVGRALFKLCQVCPSWPGFSSRPTDWRGPRETRPPSAGAFGLPEALSQVPSSEFGQPRYSKQ